tara:strand:- start:87 stop:785 length:699 start_codon:yes stop_codon:yes gene_type:complete
MFKKIIIKFLITGIILGQIENVAVFDFSNNGIDDDEVVMLTDRLRTELVKYGKVNLVERSKINEVLTEQKLQLSGCVDECLIEVGKILGASSIITGSIGKIGNYYSINARKINATTSKIENAVSYDSRDNIDDLLVSGIKIVAGKLLGIISEPEEKDAYPNQLSKNVQGSDDETYGNLLDKESRMREIDEIFGGSGTSYDNTNKIIGVVIILSMVMIIILSSTASSYSNNAY